MAVNRSGVSLGPYTRKQKLYLETENGEVMEGEFVKFNVSQTCVTLHQVEYIPSDGRVFDQYQAILSELVCLRPLEMPKADVTPAPISKAEKPKTVPENPNDFVLPEIDNSEEARQQRAERFEAKRSNLRQRLIETGLMKEIHPDVLKTLEPPPASVTGKNDAVEKPPVRETTKEAVKSPKLDDAKRSDNASPEKNQQPQLNGVKAIENQPTVTNGIYEALKSKAKGYLIIEKPGALLHSALADIEKRSIIGVGSHGGEKGRLDRLSLLTVTTESAVYLFDIQTLGKQALQKPLVAALESTSVEKVTYDCRYLSDCLYYTHRVRLQNVYDVQAADCVMYRCRKGTFQNRGRSLQELVVQYLDLPAALLSDKTNITNNKVWFQRPLQEDCYAYAAWQVVPLLQLRANIDKAFQRLMQNSFDVYLNHIRQMPRSEAVESQSSRRQIPVALLDKPFVQDF